MKGRALGFGAAIEKPHYTPTRTALRSGNGPGNCHSGQRSRATFLVRSALFTGLSGPAIARIYGNRTARLGFPSRRSRVRTPSSASEGCRSKSGPMGRRSPRMLIGARGGHREPRIVLAIGRGGNNSEATDGSRTLLIAAVNWGAVMRSQCASGLSACSGASPPRSSPRSRRGKRAEAARTRWRPSSSRVGTRTRSWRRADWSHGFKSADELRDAFAAYVAADAPEAYVLYRELDYFERARSSERSVSSTSARTRVRS